MNSIRNPRRPGRQHRNHYSIDGQFAPRTVEMLESSAYQVLSLSAHRVLARLEIELAKHGGTDNGKLPVTFDDFVRYGMDRHSIAPAIREVTALGFVEITRRGRAGNAEWRAPNHFRLTYRPTAYARPTNEWVKVQSLAEASALASTARKESKPRLAKNKTSGEKSPAPVGEKPPMTSKSQEKDALLS